MSLVRWAYDRKDVMQTGQQPASAADPQQRAKTPSSRCKLVQRGRRPLFFEGMHLACFSQGVDIAFETALNLDVYQADDGRLIASMFGVIEGDRFPIATVSSPDFRQLAEELMAQSVSDALPLLRLVPDVGEQDKSSYKELRALQSVELAVDQAVTLLVRRISPDFIPATRSSSDEE